jgi:predicted nucleotidyltransferase
MSNTYNINFADFEQGPESEAIFTALESSFARFGVDFYIVGAIAKRIWLNAIHGKRSRATNDFDIAILLPSALVFGQIKKYLTENHPFTEWSNNPFCITWKGKFNIDLLPFGEIENEDAKVIVEGARFNTIDVPGFYEIYKTDVQTMSINGGRYCKVSSLAGIVMLKVLAWNDRPEMRGKDITNIAEIIHYYFDIYSNEIYDRHNDLFDKHDNLKHLAAEVIGREIQRITNTNKPLLQKIAAIIEQDAAKEGGSVLAIEFTRYFDDTIDDNLALLRHILNGMA